MKYITLFLILGTSFAFAENKKFVASYEIQDVINDPFNEGFKGTVTCTSGDSVKTGESKICDTEGGCTADIVLDTSKSYSCVLKIKDFYDYELGAVSFKEGKPEVLEIKEGKNKNQKDDVRFFGIDEKFEPTDKIEVQTVYIKDRKNP